MPQGLKNAPMYLDDVLIFSKSLNEHVEHLEKFINLIKENGLVVSEKKIKIFQTKIRFLGFEINQGTIIPISRSIEFGDKFPNEIKDKNQLQRFLGCVNYIAEFIPNIRIICAPLYKRLRKNPPEWTNEMTQVIIEIKNLVKKLPCLGIPDPNADLIIETDASDIGYGGILKQKLPNSSKEQVVKYHSVSKYIFARWQALLSCFDFEIEHIKGKHNFLPDFLTREFLQGFNEQQSSKTDSSSTSTGRTIASLRPNYQNLTKSQYSLAQILANPIPRPTNSLVLKKHIYPFILHYHIFPKTFHYLPNNPLKTQRFYEFVLMDTDSAEITHTRDDQGSVLFSKMKIINILSSQDWNQHLFDSKTFSNDPYVEKPELLPIMILESYIIKEDLKTLIAHIFPKTFHYLPNNLLKTQRFYEFVLVDTDLAEITHTRDDQESVLFSKMKIINILSPQDWNQHLFDSKTFSNDPYIEKPELLPIMILESYIIKEDLKTLIAHIFPKTFHYLPNNLLKTQRFYEFVLVDTDSAEITHTRDDQESVLFSKMKIINILSPQDWNQHFSTPRPS
ncbi:Enzymatic polyprotein, partial [Mucuna pruriens]